MPVTWIYQKSDKPELASWSHRVCDGGGEYLVRVSMTGSPRYPLRGGQGDYEPRDVLLVWMTADGVTWTFSHAVICGPQIEKRTDEPGRFGASQTISLGDTTYADCEPVWLAGLVDKLAPRTAR
jgi:hypothetical protein